MTILKIVRFKVKIFPKNIVYIDSGDKRLLYGSEYRRYKPAFQESEKPVESLVSEEQNAVVESQEHDSKILSQENLNEEKSIDEPEEELKQLKSEGRSS